MRWKQPQWGDTRIIKRFALFPITVGSETRWLEWCYIKQHYGITMWLEDGFVDKEALNEKEV